MYKLLRAELRRLRKNKFFLFCCLGSFALAACCILVRWASLTSENYAVGYTDLLFTCTLYLIFGMAAFISLFTGTEFSENTVRNKLMLGHKRLYIYLTDFIVCALGSILLFVLSVTTMLLLGNWLIGPPTQTADVIWSCFFASLAASISLTALLMLMPMTMGNKAGGAVSCLLLLCLLLFTAAWLNAQLSEPEIKEGYMMLDTETMEFIEGEAMPNPNYISGARRVVYQTMFDLLPTGFLIDISNMDTENFDRMLLCCGLLTALSLGGGVLQFQKKDIR